MSTPYLHHVDIDELAKRAGLDITAEEHDDLQRDIDQALHLFEMLESVDTSHVDHVTMRQPVAFEQLRPDAVDEARHPTAICAFSTYFDEASSLFKVPQVIESE